MTAVLTAYLLFGVLHILLMAFWSWVFRAGITEIAFGFGPKLFSVGIVSCKLLPVGGSVSLLEQAPEAGERLERQSYVDLALWKKLAIAVAPILTLLTLCSGVLGAG